MFTLALITGADLLVEELDIDYFNSLKRFKQVLDKFFPDLNFNGKLIVKRLIKNDVKNNGNALMFSGGMDSTHLYIKLRNVKPDLFTIIGGTIPVTNKKLIMKFRRNIIAFAEHERVNLNLIETNILQVLNEGLLTARYGQNFPQTSATWWGKVNHGIVQLSVCAPITVIHNVGSIHISASIRPYPDGTHARVVDKIYWGGTKVVPDVDGTKRFDKIKAIYEPNLNVDSLPQLQTCIISPAATTQLNCGSCKKCLGPIVSLMALGHDPRKYGYPIINRLDEHLKRNILPRSDVPEEWVRIQEGIEENHDIILNEYKPFLQWFKELKFNPPPKQKPDYGQRIKCGVLNLTTRLPKKIQEKILKTYYKTMFIKK